MRQTYSIESSTGTAVPVDKLVSPRPRTPERDVLDVLATPREGPSSIQRADRGDPLRMQGPPTRAERGLRMDGTVELAEVRGDQPPPARRSAGAASAGIRHAPLLGDTVRPAPREPPSLRSRAAAAPRVLTIIRYPFQRSPRTPRLPRAPS